MLRPYCRISPLLSGLRREKSVELVLMAIFCVSWPLCSLYLLEPASCRKVFLRCFTSLQPSICRSYQPLLEGTVSHQDPYAAAQHPVHPGVGVVLCLCWLPSDRAERPHFVTSEGFSPAEKEKAIFDQSPIEKHALWPGGFATPAFDATQAKAVQQLQKLQRGEKRYNYGKEKGWACLDFGLKTLWLASHSA